MEMLYPFLPFAPCETPLSWAARQAAKHTGGRLGPFLNDMGIPLARLAGGHADAIQRLCELTGQDPEIVEHNTIRSLCSRSFELRGETFSAGFMIGGASRFCPACLAEDEGDGSQPHVRRLARLEWRLAPVRVCRHHHLPLIERQHDGRDGAARELRMLVPETGAELRMLAADLPHCSPSPLQDYVVGRLEGGKGPDWLDSQRIDRAVRATEMLGAVLRFGPDAKAGDLRLAEWDEAGRAGWPCTSGGPESVRDALDLLHAGSLSRGSGHLRRISKYGMLYVWAGSAALSRDPAPMCEILREHILDNMDVQAGQLLLGKTVLKPRRSSIASLAASEGLHCATFKNVLLAKGEISEAESELPGSQVLLDFDTGMAAAEEMKRAVAVTLLPQILNASRPMVSALLEAGILTLLHDAGLKQARIRKSVDREHLDALLTRIQRIAMPVSEIPGSMLPLAKSAKISGKKMQQVLAAVFGGQLRRVMRLEAKPGLGGLLVDPREVGSLSPCARPGMPASFAFMMLGIGEAAGKRLISDQAGEALLEAVAVPGEDEPWITPAAMASFRSRFVTFRSLMIEAKCKRPQLKRMLDSHGVAPAFDPKSLGATLFRRSDLPDDLDI
ncbi:TniQ family protein (plasmid) [Leisingera aquaemixtae]|uniref:TniQ family protein n=1 Tax=Leisingera aquaemixtae TaxID=1396826 RepID=UPI0039845715